MRYRFVLMTSHGAGGISLPKRLALCVRRWRLYAAGTVKAALSSSTAAAGRQARVLSLRWLMRPLGDDERAWREFLTANYGKLD
jgi:hypothetical protein